VEVVSLTKGEIELQVTLATSDTEVEVRMIYVGKGSRSVYKGDGIILATRIFNDLVKEFSGQGFAGQVEPLDAYDVALAIGEIRPVEAS
jgi:hypothetical protein